MYKVRDFKSNNIILGMNGLKKSLYQDIITDFSNTYDKQIFLIDVFGRYKNLLKDIEFVNYYLDSIKVSINPFDLKISEFDDYMLFRKIDFLFIFFENILNRELTKWEKRILDKEIIEFYNPYIKYLKENDLTIDRKKCPILEDFLEKIKFNEDLYDLKVALKIFTTGKLSYLFNNKTNILDDFIINFDISKLDKSLQELVYLNCLEYIYQKSGENLDDGYKTFIFIEENYFLFQQFVFEYFKYFLVDTRNMGGTIFLNYSFVENLVTSKEGIEILSLSNRFFLFKMNILEASLLKKEKFIDDVTFNKLQELKKGEKIVL